MRIPEAVDSFQALYDLFEHDNHKAHASLLRHNPVLPLVQTVASVCHQDFAHIVLYFVGQQLRQPVVLRPLGGHLRDVLVQL